MEANFGGSGLFVAATVRFREAGDILRHIPGILPGIAFSEIRAVAAGAGIKRLTETAIALARTHEAGARVDDGAVGRRGRAQRERIDAMLSAIPKDQAKALWAMYAPAVLGAWRSL